MEEIVLVTHNKGKAKSAERYFNNLKFSTYDFELDEPRSIEGILKLMENEENRKCRFEECLAYHDGKKIHYFYGKHPGNLATKIQGMDREEKWSDLWYIFKPEHYEKTLAEMDKVEREERRKIDGSVAALKVFAEWYKKENSIF